MMRVLSFGLFICRLMVVASPLQTFHAPARETHVPQPAQSTYHPHPNYPQPNHPNYDDGLRRNHFHRPPSFKLPHFTHLKWTHPQTYPHHQDYNRRTFLHDLPFDHHRTTTSFPTFYQFMTSLFAGGDDYPDKFPHHNRDRPTLPYSFSPTEPNYIPPPKPIRASVVKLESITRSPLFSSFEPETTTKYFHNVGTLLNHVLNENSKSAQHSPFLPQEAVDDDKIPPFKPLPVLPTPKYTSSTITPSRLPHYRYNKTDYKYPESVQDQLPHLQFADPKIPYVREKPIPQIFATLPTETSPREQFGYTRLPDSGDPTDILELIDIRSFNLSGTNPPERGERFELEGTKTKSFPGAVEKVNRPMVRFTKKLSTQLDKTSVEKVTNLTVQGLSNPGEVANPHRRVNYPNARDLMDFKFLKRDNSSKRLVNLNDELSLDAKILKDTNWDGLGPSQPEEASTPVANPKKNKPAFWEIIETDKATLPVTESTTPTTIFTSERGRSETTTEWWSATRDNTETNEPSTTTEETTTPEGSRLVQRRTGSHPGPESLKAVTPESEIVLTERTPRKRYSRRPKIVSFTPYPTTEEVQKRLANRNHFPKRQKPNITLAFGNKNVFKGGHQSFIKDEVMKFSDEEVRKRRKTGKRRQLYERLRASSSERSARQDSL